MSTPSYDLSTPESRRAIFDDLHRQEASVRRVSRICRAQNIPAAAVFALCMLVCVLGLACCVADRHFDLPLLQPVLDAVAAVPGGVYTFAVLGAVVPLVFAGLFRLALTPAVKEEPVAAASWPDSEEHQLYAILKQVHVVMRATSHRLATPAKVLLYIVPLITCLLGGILVCVAAGCTDGFSFGDVGWGLLYTAAAAVGTLIFAFLVKKISSPARAKLTELEELAESRRAAFKGTRKYRK